MTFDNSRVTSTGKIVSGALGLTRKMARCKEFIAVYSEMHGICPSFEEIRDNLGLANKSGVHRLISSLEQRGHIKRLPRHARSLQIIEAS